MQQQIWTVFFFLPRRIYLELNKRAKAVDLILENEEEEFPNLRTVAVFIY